LPQLQDRTTLDKQVQNDQKGVPPSALSLSRALSLSLSLFLSLSLSLHSSLPPVSLKKREYCRCSFGPKAPTSTCT
jgi:hypothetical protein